MYVSGNFATDVIIAAIGRQNAVQGPPSEMQPPSANVESWKLSLHFWPTYLDTPLSRRLTVDAGILGICTLSKLNPHLPN